MFFLLWITNFLYAADTTIIVEEHRNIEVYVSNPIVKNYSEETESIVGAKSVYGYTNIYWRDAKVINNRGTFDPITMHSIIKAYDKNTISYAYRNCNYLIDAKECSNQNNHYLLETYITIDDHETHIQMILFNPDMSVLSVSNVSDRGKIKYIKQQETRISMTSGKIEMRVMPEQKPLKWIIPAHLLDIYIQQAVKGLWLGVKIQ